MAVGHGYTSSVKYSNFCVENLNVDDFRPYKMNYDIVYDGKRLKWNNNYVELRNFFENIVGVSGKWTVPSGNARRFQSNDSELIVTWYRGKQRTLLFQGKDGYLLRKFLINVCLNSKDISPSPKEVQLLLGRNDSDKCLVGDKTSSVSHITPTSEDTILCTNTSTIKEHEDFIDNSFYNVSTVLSPDYIKNSTEVFSNSSLLQQRAEANPETIEARFSTFKQKIESEMLGLLTKLSEQEKIITSSKQQLCKLRGENLNLKSRISKLEEKLSSADESLENSSNYVQDQKQSQHPPTSTHLNSFKIQSESRLIVNNETENVQSCNNNSSTKDTVASEFFTGRLLRGENLNLKSRISKSEEKLFSIDESLENSSNYVQDQKQSQRHPTSTHLSLFQTQSESRLIVNNETENVQSRNNNSSTKDPVASEVLSPNDIPDKLNPISIVQSFGPKQHNQPKKINPLSLKQIGSLPLINLSKSPKDTASRYSEGEKKINNTPNLELTGNLPLTDLPKRPRCTADRNGGIEKRINNNYKSPTVGSESRSPTNCPEQRQISTITIEPIPTSITKSNPVFPGLVHKLNLPLIESPKSIDTIERRDQHKTLKTPFWQGRLSHPTRHRTNSQARMKRPVNGTYQRMKTITNELERYLRYVSQTIKY